MKNLNQIYVYPTDTVWGIGCNINSEIGFRNIAKIKQTSTEKPLSVLFTSKDELKEYFQLAEEMLTVDFLNLFSMGLTVLIPSTFLKKEFPDYLLLLSPYVSVRLLENELLKKMRNEIGAPFFTTSLNITGQAPIVSEEGAVLFVKNECPHAKLIPPQNHIVLSGVSSTIIKLVADNKFEIVRAGENVEQIKNYLLALNLL